MLDVAEAMGTARHAALLLASEWLACSHVFSSDDFPILGLAGSVLTGCISNNFIQCLFVLTLTDIFCVSDSGDYGKDGKAKVLNRSPLWGRQMAMHAMPAGKREVR